MVIAQVYGRVVDTNGSTVVKRRGGTAVTPPIQQTLTGILTRIEVFNDGRAAPVDPGGGPGGGTTNPRDALVYGVDRPTTATTGHITPLAQMTDYNSPNTQNVTLSTPNEVIRGKRIYGIVARGADNILIEDCIFLGPPAKPSSETAVVNCLGNVGKNTVLRDCTIAPRWPNPYMDCMKGSEYTAERLHCFWGVDGFGVFNTGGSTKATNVKIMGCLVEANVYFHGDGYSSPGTSYLNTSGGYSAWGSTSVVRTVDQWVDTGHHDGNHADGIQIQGGYGGMTRNANGTWSGDGIYIIGNFLAGNEAEHNMADPSGSGLIVPGQAGSLSGSRLGTMDSMKRNVNQSPTMTIPFTGGYRMTNGKYPVNGSGVIINPGVNAFPFPSTAAPNKFTVVCIRNWIDGYNSAFNLQRGVMGTMQVAVLNNRIGPHVFEFSPGTNPSTYPIRIYVTSGGVKQYETIKFAPPDSNASAAPSGAQGNAGLATQVWDDPTNRFGTNGSPLTEGRNSGIVYS